MSVINTIKTHYEEIQEALETELIEPCSADELEIVLGAVKENTQIFAIRERCRFIAEAPDASESPYSDKYYNAVAVVANCDSSPKVVFYQSGVQTPAQMLRAAGMTPEGFKGVSNSPLKIDRSGSEYAPSYLETHSMSDEDREREREEYEREYGAR